MGPHPISAHEATFDWVTALKTQNRKTLVDLTDHSLQTFEHPGLRWLSAPARFPIERSHLAAHF